MIRLAVADAMRLAAFVALLWWVTPEPVAEPAYINTSIYHWDLGIYGSWDQVIEPGDYPTYGEGLRIYGPPLYRDSVAGSSPIRCGGTDYCPCGPRGADGEWCPEGGR